MRQGEVWTRGDAAALVVVVSGDLYNTADTGRVVVCPVIPGDPFGDFTFVIPLNTPVSGFVVPDLVTALPTAALTERRGDVEVKDKERILSTVRGVLGL